MERFEYKDNEGDLLSIEVEVDGTLTVSTALDSAYTEQFINVDPLDVPRIALALLERAGHKAGGKSLVDFAVSALKDHEKAVSRQKEGDEKVVKYFKEVRQQNLQTVLDWHREEFKRAEKFSKEVFGRKPRTIPHGSTLAVDKSAKWKTQSLGPIYFTFKYSNGNWWSTTNYDADDDWRIYGPSLGLLSHSYFPLEEVLD